MGHKLHGSAAAARRSTRRTTPESALSRRVEAVAKHLRQGARLALMANESGQPRAGAEYLVNALASVRQDAAALREAVRNPTR